MWRTGVERGGVRTRILAAHHEAWKHSDLNQRQYCEAEGYQRSSAQPLHRIKPLEREELGSNLRHCSLRVGQRNPANCSTERSKRNWETNIPRSENWSNDRLFGPVSPVQISLSLAIFIINIATEMEPPVPRARPRWYPRLTRLHTDQSYA